MNLDQTRPTTTTAGLFVENEMNADTIISDHFFRPVSTSLPQWDHQPSVSQMSPFSVSMSSSLDEIHSQGSTLKGDHDSHSVNSDHYDSYGSGSGSGSGKGDEQLSLPITPTSDQSQHDHLMDETDGGPSRKKRIPVPDEKKDNKYWDRRRKNNEAAKRSRDIRKKRMDDEIKLAKEAVTENQKLKQEIDVLKAEINSLRRLLRDANMTLSLWIRARQASEPNSQLPPMIRGPNVSFVNFPVTKSIE